MDAAMDLQGGRSIFKAVGFEQLLRNARLAKIHLANNAPTMEFVGNTALEINPDEAPRWG